MTAVTERHASTGPASGAADSTLHCLRCGAEVAADQEWCLECGTARTVIHAPPDWRIPLAVVGVVVVVVVLAFVIALVNLSIVANH